MVEEDSAKVVAVRKDFILVRQVGSSGIDEVQAGEVILLRDLLGAEVLLDRDRKVGAALYRRVIGDDHALDAANAANSSDDSCGRDVSAI